MTVSYLERVGVFVPESRMSVRELSPSFDLTSSQERFLSGFLGLREIAVATDVELADMLVSAGEDALRDVDRDAVRFVIHGHTMQHVAVGFPHLLDEVCERLGLRDATPFSMSHINCVVGLHALRTARYLLADARPEEKVLVLTGDKVLAHEGRLIPGVTIQGDAAAACLVGRDPRGCRLLGSATDVLGRFYQCLDCPEPLQAEYKQIYVECLSKVMRDAVEDAGREPADISMVLPHNVNRLSWKRIAGNVGIPVERVYLDNVPKFGHCYSSDPFINLATARDSERVMPGDVVLLATAGLGATFGATVIEIGEGNDR